MNYSLYSIDRSTHAKIVAVALIAATIVAWIGIAVHSRDGSRQERAQYSSLIKAGKPAIVVSRTEIAIR